MVIVAMLAFLVAYVPPALSGQWVYEDSETMVPAYAAFYTQPLDARSLTNLSLRVTPTPATYRLGNIALHATVVGLLSTFTILWPLAMLHPISTETIMYASGRGELIVAIGVLIACLGVARLGATATVLGVLIALTGKESGVVVLPLVVLAMWYYRRYQPWVISACVGLMVAGFFWYGGLDAITRGFGVNPWVSDILWYEWLLVQGGAVAYWLMSLVWLPLLTPDADIDSLSMAVRFVGLGAIILSGVIAWTYRSFGLALFAVSLIPRLVVQTPGGYLNAHQFYVPFIGLTIAGAELRTQIMEAVWLRKQLRPR